MREFGTARDVVPPPVEEEPDVSALAVDENGQEEQLEYRESRSSTNRLGRVPRPARGARSPAADEAEQPRWEEPPEEIDFDPLADTAEAPEVAETDSVPFWNGLLMSFDVSAFVRQSIRPSKFAAEECVSDDPNTEALFRHGSQSKRNNARPTF